MDYQLVLQFPGDSMADFEALVALEDELTEKLGESAEVDGHDFGSGTGNIFVLTSDPAVTLQLIIPVIEGRRQLQNLTVAFREVEGERYAVLWPEGSRAEFTMM